MLLGFGLYVVWDQHTWWMSREDYSFGFLVPFFAGYVVMERWPAIRAALVPGEAGAAVASGGRWAGAGRALLALFWGAVFVLALLSLGFGSLLRATQGVQTAASLSVAWGYGWLVLSTVYLFSGQRADGCRPGMGTRLRLTALFLFPAMIWLISAPLLSFLERGLSLFLLNRVSAVVFFLFDLFGVPIAQEGNILILGVLDDGQPNQVMVEDACSGIRSLMACLFAGSFLAAIFLDVFWKKVLLVGLSMLFAFLMNIARSTFLTFVAYRYGSDSIEGAVHDITGYGVLVLTCVGLLALLPVMNFQHRFSGDPFAAESAPEAGASSG